MRTEGVTTTVWQGSRTLLFSNCSQNLNLPHQSARNVLAGAHEAENGVLVVNETGQCRQAVTCIASPQVACHYLESTHSRLLLRLPGLSRATWLRSFTYSSMPSTESPQFEEKSFYNSIPAMRWRRLDFPLEILLPPWH